jgi:outer membrane receptor protein involved in Fe transport
MKNLLLVTIGVLFFATTVKAQQEPEPELSEPVITIRSNSLYGRVTDKNTNKGVEAVSVQLYAGSFYDSLVTAMFTRPNGDFRFNNLPVVDSFKLVITAVGFARQERIISFNEKDNAGTVTKDLGNLFLEQDVQTLAAVTVTSQRPALEMGIDRRVFNVDQSLTATGGTALDVMKNIPSVTVDVDGNVTLRNSSPQIFVDGRPTILTLDQIPAGDIERIELITNPSAKFDAASTGGIINVIMKRNRRVGINGIVTAGIGYPDILNGNLSLNMRQNKFNFFLTGNHNQSGGKTTRKTLRQNKMNGVVDNYFNQFSTNERNRLFNSIRFGVDFFADNRNTISFTQGMVKGNYDNEEEQSQEFLNSSKILERYGERNSISRSENERYNTQLNYTHKFPKQGKEFTASINYNYGKGNDNSDIQNLFYESNGTLSSSATVLNRSTNNNNQLTFQADYVDPYSENSKIEAGVRSYVNNYKNLFSAFSVKNGSQTLLPLSNNIEYREMVNAFYLTYSNKINTFAYQAGLRAEHSQFDGKLLDSGKEFGYNYPTDFKNIFDALFPSLFLTKQVGDRTEMQLNYSRRIRRPSFWQLNPFVDINDPLNISQGNPALRPEFTNSFEFNYNQRYNSGSFLGSVYYRNTQGDITRFSDTITAEQYQQLNEAAIEPNAILNTFINAKAMNRVGAEFTLQHKIGKNFDITPTINGEYQMVSAETQTLDLSNSGFNWEAKLITNYRIATEKPSFFNNFSFQAIGEYESPRIMPQGETNSRIQC